MKTIVLFVAKLIFKVSLAAALAALYLFNIVFAFCASLLRYMALPVMFVAAVIAITTYSDHGMVTDVVECIWTFVAAAAFYFTLPLLPQLVAWLLDLLISVFHSISLFGERPVKYIYD